eukprot:6185098-Pleurochrysis_carterae.AAC.2
MPVDCSARKCLQRVFIYLAPVRLCSNALLSVTQRSLVVTKRAVARRSVRVENVRWCNLDGVGKVLDGRGVVPSLESGVAKLFLCVRHADDDGVALARNELSATRLTKPLTRCRLVKQMFSHIEVDLPGKIWTCGR